MPRISKELTVLEVKKLPAGSTKALGGVRGLYLRKTSPNGGFYFLRYMLHGSSHDFGLGPYPDVSLAAAREMARGARGLVDQGRDPVAEKAARGAEARRLKAEEEAAAHPVTFRMVAEEWLAESVKAKRWQNNRKGERDTRNGLSRNVYPVLGDMPIEDIKAEDVKRCLEPIWQTKPTVARKSKTYIGKICRWAIATGKRKDQSNPASMDGALGVLLEPMKNGRRPSRNLAACPAEELPQLMEEIHSYKSMSARALEFAILSAARSQAVRLATWSEFDLERGIWTIPVQHDKVKAEGRDRTIFLSGAALALLRNIPLEEGGSLVFQSNQGGPLSAESLEQFLMGLHEKKLERDGVGWIDPVKSKLEGRPCRITPHAVCRATFRTWAKDDELGNNRRFDQEAVELCLLHSKNDGFNGAYDRARLEKERRAIMEAWGEYACRLIKAGAATGPKA